MKDFYKFIEEWDWSSVAIDKAHACLLYGVVTSSKPIKVLEIGVGSGFVTRTILHGLDYNCVGNLTCVDSFHDWGGKEPSHIQDLKSSGVTLINSTEDSFVHSCQDKFDLIISDGDHRRGGLWADKVYDLLEPDGILFAHDVLMDRYPTLRNYISIAKQREYSYRVFSENTRKEEMCDRGWLMVIKNERKD